MPFSNIDKPSKYFTAKTYTGTGSSLTITGLEFSPDFIWGKNRTVAYAHVLTDIIRSSGKCLFSNTTDAEVTDNQRISAFTSDGFTVGTDASLNGSGNSQVVWCWDANGSGVSNTSGTITSTVSANTTSGFSIVTYTGAGGASTVGHGLGVAPRVVIVKSRSNTTNWILGHSSIGWNKYMTLNSDIAVETNNYFNDTAPTSSVFSIFNSTNVNGSGYTYVAYCFAEVKGYSKFGSYTGNGSTDGTFVYTGFKPAFFIVKTSNATFNWVVEDNKRNTFNVVDKYLLPNTSDAEGTLTLVDFLSNGIKIRTTDNSHNGSGNTHIYMAFADNPFVSSKGIPTTAR